MRWKQFLTPVKSLDADKARAFIHDHDEGEYEIVDVRQPKEYQAGHIPGARLAPLGELDEKTRDLDKDKPVLVYCAVGGRSRVAAQIMAGKGFGRVLNLSGGFKAWNGEAAYGPVDQGLHLFGESLDLRDSLLTAFGLEQGLQEMYLLLADRASADKAKDLFRKLADIEQKHKARLLEEYRRRVAEDAQMPDMETRARDQAAEGGLTTEQYMQRFQPDLDDLENVLSMAMSIEAQAMDLYERAARRMEDEKARQALIRLGQEEKEHLQRLGELMDEPD
ncbi:MAG: rhodanese-like domain-containing protein [Desulfovibrionaceae bacterium]